jgi:N-methylhydantoinase A/oxoprolinase/acetone carboxylase beta subunit
MAGKSQARESFRVGFDIGGTFTDLVVANRSGTIRTGKVLTTPDEIMVGVLQGFAELLARNDIPPAAISEIVVGATTVVTNLIIERKGARTGLIVTKGFADVIEIGRELRYDVYDLAAGFPEPLVPKALRMEVDERVDFQGKVVHPIDAGEVEAAIKALAAKGATSLAVCLLHSYVNAEHEKLIRKVAERAAPGMHVSLSCEILPEIREYERTVATVLNAYVRPYIGNYLQRIEEGFASVFGSASLRLMQSSGGMISRDYAERLPLRMLESGPAAGALAAAHLADSCGLKKIIAFDMGGTTAKACLITSGEPEVTTEFETARVHRFKRGSGFPVKLPIIDLIEIGAGGGSIAHIDQTGLLKVGPGSAGAKPGPACYGLGGKLPTVTDAALVLGYLDRNATLSGAVRMQYDKARASIEAKIAKPLGMTVLEAAVGIYRIVCEQMAAAAKIHAVEKGRDLREYALVAFGGAGPIHACDVARRLRCKEVLIPPDAGVYSAIGLLLAPNKVDAVRSYYVRLGRIDWKEVEAFQADMQRDIAAALGSADIPPGEIVYRNSADMRYVGQGFEVSTPIPLKLDSASAGAIDASFKQAYAAKFGRSLDDVEVEIVSWRMEGIAKTAWLDERASPVTAAALARSPAQRPVYFLERGAFVDTPVHASDELARGSAHRGPMLIEQPGSTILIGPDDTFDIDARGIVRVAVAPMKQAAAAGKPQ